MKGWHRIRLAYAGGYFRAGEPVKVLRLNKNGMAMVKYIGQRGFCYIHKAELEPIGLFEQLIAMARHWVCLEKR